MPACTAAERCLLRHPAAADLSREQAPAARETRRRMACTQLVQ
eukprot:CAMPEP_0170394430 /NCGR_PEP_ID=MMETSP0117_2-20130122/21254_1 /TAXON_ID=400756 /ORGANISM="Durinskia baltica, Strain CSIRO CS-38" /LENGTH=42 /DNA_ID= /DNA_START= /DNA_END= /DNA_ORIENTATION=